MANLAVTNTFADGNIITASGHNTNNSDIVNYINNRNDGSATWDCLKVTASSQVPLVVNNSSGSNNIANFQDNGSNVVTILDGGGVTLAADPASTPAANTLYKANIIKGWISMNGTGTIAINDSFNVSGIVDDGVGVYTITWDRDFSNNDYAVAGNVIDARYMTFEAPADGSIQIKIRTLAGTLDDPTLLTLIAIGDQ